MIKNVFPQYRNDKTSKECFPKLYIAIHICLYKWAFKPCSPPAWKLIIQGHGNGICPTFFYFKILSSAFSFLPLLNEISIVWRAFSLPILEPLTPKRMENIVTVMMSCLYASLSVAVTNTVIAMTSTAPVKPATGKEEENENYGCSIIQKSVCYFVNP